MKALVTGAPGFIGSFLCKGLINRRIDVSAFALPGEGVAHLEDEGIEIHRGDLKNFNTPCRPAGKRENPTSRKYFHTWLCLPGHGDY